MWYRATVSTLFSEKIRSMSVVSVAVKASLLGRNTVTTDCGYVPNNASKFNDCNRPSASEYLGLSRREVNAAWTCPAAKDVSAYYHRSSPSEWLSRLEQTCTHTSLWSDSREFFNHASRSLCHGHRYTKHLISLTYTIHHRPTLLLEKVLHDKVKKTTRPQWPFWF